MGAPPRRRAAAATSSGSSSPTWRSRLGRRSRRGARAWARPYCGGKARGIAPIASRRCCSAMRPARWTKRSPRSRKTWSASRRSRRKWPSWIRRPRGKRAVVACLSTQAFIDELISAIDGNRVDWWQARYRRATALLLDDIHLLAGKERTQEELFNLFNLLQDKDRQLVFTAPAHPNTLTGLEERIVSRLEGGLVAELKEPDRDVKRAVLERLLTQQGANPEAALIDYLSDRPTDSVRSLVGMLQRVVSAAAAQDGPLSAGLAREVLEGQSARDTRRSSGFRTSGLVVSSLGGIKSREKVVWDWADVADRMIEEFR